MKLIEIEKGQLKTYKHTRHRNDRTRYNIITLLTAFSGYPPPSLGSLQARVTSHQQKIRMSTSHQQAGCTKKLNVSLDHIG